MTFAFLLARRLLRPRHVSPKAWRRAATGFPAGRGTWRARVGLKASAGSAVTLGTAMFVKLSHEDNRDPLDTGEGRMMEASRAELQRALAGVTRGDGGEAGILGRMASWLDFYLWEPLCTGFRFLHLVAIFVPVIVSVPALWIGCRHPERDNERTGTLWWYGFLVKSMEYAGPAFIKLGQWAASRTDIFPTEMCEIMSRLHSHAPAHPMHITRATVEAAFGGRAFDDIFEEFNETPLGVGAIAQVYKAKLRPDLPSSPDSSPSYSSSGSSSSSSSSTVRRRVDSVLKSSPQRVPSNYVAVKVLHPRVERIVGRDLKIMAFFAAALNAIPTMEWLSLPDEVSQFGQMMRLQLDLRIEAANLETFRHNFRDRPTAWFPYPYSDFTTRHVLIEEYAQGIPLADFMELGAGVFQHDIANQGLDAFLRMLLLDNFIHADLHPGNIMVRFYPGSRQQQQHPHDVNQPRGENQPHGGNRGSIPPSEITEQILQRLRRCRNRPNPRAAWAAELAKIETEGYRPQLIFIDTGLVTELNATNRANFLALFRAVAEFDGYKAGHLMCERCRQPDAVIDKEVFALRMQHLVLGVKSRTLALGRIRIGDILQQVLAMVRNHHVRLEGDFVNVVISILLLEGIGRSLNPRLDLLSSSLPILRQLGAQSGAEMAKQGDYSMILLWMGLETRRFLQASIEDVERCVKYDLLSPNI